MGQLDQFQVFTSKSHTSEKHVNRYYISTETDMNDAVAVAKAYSEEFKCPVWVIHFTETVIMHGDKLSSTCRTYELAAFFDPDPRPYDHCFERNFVSERVREETRK